MTVTFPGGQPHCAPHPTLCSFHTFLPLPPHTPEFIQVHPTHYRLAWLCCFRVMPAPPHRTCLARATPAHARTTHLPYLRITGRCALTRNAYVVILRTFAGAFRALYRCGTLHAHYHAAFAFCAHTAHTFVRCHTRTFYTTFFGLHCQLRTAWRHFAATPAGQT